MLLPVINYDFRLNGMSEPCFFHAFTRFYSLLPLCLFSMHFFIVVISSSKFYPVCQIQIYLPRSSFCLNISSRYQQQQNCKNKQKINKCNIKRNTMMILAARTTLEKLLCWRFRKNNKNG